jgi:hypothetical protein
MGKEPKNLFLKKQDAPGQESKQEPKEPKQESKAAESVQDTKRPTNLRANAVPVDGFVLSVDGKFKSRYDTSKDAMAAGTKLKQAYPVIQVAVYDAVGHNYTAIELPGQEKSQAAAEPSA